MNVLLGAVFVVFYFAVKAWADLPASAVEEGDCLPKLPAFPGVEGLVSYGNPTTGSWFAPAASKHFIRSYYEYFNCKVAKTQSDIDAWNLKLTYIVNFVIWTAYGKTSLDSCVPIPNPLNETINFPTIHCTLASFPIPLNILQVNFTLLYADADNRLLYRCSEGKKDWVLLTRNTTTISPNATAAINNIIPVLGFNLSYIEYQTY